MSNYIGILIARVLVQCARAIVEASRNGDYGAAFVPLNQADEMINRVARVAEDV